MKIIVDQAERLTRAEIEIANLRKEVDGLKETAFRVPTQEEIEKAKKAENEILKSFAMYAQEDPDTVVKIFGNVEGNG